MEVEQLTLVWLLRVDLAAIFSAEDVALYLAYPGVELTPSEFIIAAQMKISRSATTTTPKKFDNAQANCATDNELRDSDNDTIVAKRRLLARLVLKDGRVWYERPTEKRPSVISRRGARSASATDVWRQRRRRSDSLPRIIPLMLPTYN
jgi:hypothetical protein